MQHLNELWFCNKLMYKLIDLSQELSYFKYKTNMN